MTYKEFYLKCETFEELERVMKRDVAMALLLNKDRIPVIEKSFNEVFQEKFNKEVE